MTDASGWLGEIEQHIQKATTSLYTVHEFRSLIDELMNRADCPVDYLSIVVDQKPPFANTEIIDTRSDTTEQVDETRKPPLGESGDAVCILRYKQREGFPREHLDRAIVRLVLLTTTFWADDMRDAKSRIRANQNANDRRRIQNTIERWESQNRTLHFCFADIDKFKRVNDVHGQDVGDRVILETASILQSELSERAIPIHRSGDEFWFFVPDSSDVECIELAYRISLAIDRHDFKLSETPVGISVGIAEIEPAKIQDGFETFEKLAEKAVKLPHDQGKVRGTARLRSSENLKGKDLSVESTRESVCLAKSRLTGNMPFYSPWLNFLASRVQSFLLSTGGNVDALQSEFDQIIEWVKPTTEGQRTTSALCEYEARPILSGFDALMAAACGIFRYGFANNIEVESPLVITNKVSRIELASQRGQSLLSLSFEGELDSVNLGAFIKRGDGECDCGCQQAILIHIGHNVDPMVKPLFADVITVDDRPTKGGELRDFWEATIARLVAGLNRCAATNAVFLVGEKRYASETVARLEDIESWRDDSHLLSLKTGMSVESILRAATKILGNIHIVDGKDQLIQRLAELLLQPVTLSCGELESRSFLRARTPVLTRTLNAGPFRLDITDGCKVKTIAEAFPVTTEILRMSEIKTVRDHAGMHLREVTDFKIRVTDPSDESLPLFYSKELESFNEYADRAFLHEQSLFGQRLANQWRVVCEGICEGLADYPQISTTRRAILVVPYETSSSKDPLGLVCVRVSPRKEGGKIALDFSFVWRTVEALVGFPYSIYGSVRYAKYLLDEVRNTLDGAGEGIGRFVELGNLTYIAMSLHMFVDEYGQNIAKRIVDDESG